MSVRMRRRPRLSYANVMSTFAVFAALGGTAFAAAPLITGKEIKDSSITSADVKNRSLTELDFAASSLAKLRGATGAAGAAGAAGPTGARGDTGAAGAAGATGLQGLAGLPGIQGPPGADGADLAGSTWIHVDADGTVAANGTALTGAVADITDASFGKPYVVQLSPGKYELDARLEVPSFVTIAGAGLESSFIINSTSFATPIAGVVLLDDNSVLRDLEINASGGADTAGVFLDGGWGKLDRVSLYISGSSASGITSTNAGGTAALRDSFVYTTGSGSAAVRNTNAQLYGTRLSAQGPGVTGVNTWLRATHSEISGSGGVAVNMFGGLIAIGASGVEGVVSMGGGGPVTCVASWGQWLDPGFTALDSACA